MHLILLLAAKMFTLNVQILIDFKQTGAHFNQNHENYIHQSLLKLQSEGRPTIFILISTTLH